jgi:regulator of protease activity HflC (stomatin/prohibitin superfamily)
MRKLVLGLALAALAAGCAKVESGELGVLWTAWSGTQPDIYKEGWYAVAPWNKMWVYNVRTQDKQEDLNSLANNGLSIRMEASVRYRPDGEKVSELHTTVGEEYYNVLIAPALRSVVRKVGGRYSPEEIYATKRQVVEQEIFQEVKLLLEGRPVILEAIMVRNVDLPEELKKAINEKLAEEQRALKMEFTLQKERQEAERKKIEAQGMADANRILSESINDNLLRYRGLEATERLANSQNTKVVVLGSGKDGLPLILGGP